MNDPLPPSCSEQQTLIEEVRKHLIHISELTRAAADAVRNRDEDLTRKLDHETEQEVGKKERALGALRQHRRDHGC